MIVRQEQPVFVFKASLAGKITGTIFCVAFSVFCTAIFFSEWVEKGFEVMVYTYYFPLQLLMIVGFPAFGVLLVNWYKVVFYPSKITIRKWYGPQFEYSYSDLKDIRIGKYEKSDTYATVQLFFVDGKKALIKKDIRGDIKLDAIASFLKEKTRPKFEDLDNYALLGLE